MIFKLEISFEDDNNKEVIGCWEYECPRPSKAKKLKWLNEISDDLINRIMEEEGVINE
tara:strand:+ start:819 stop:992 length:174 start_codon:yes stop_codon:yes gene_type:complete